MFFTKTNIIFGRMVEFSKNYNSLRYFLKLFVCLFCTFLSMLPTLAIASYKTPEEVFQKEFLYDARGKAYKAFFENQRTIAQAD